MSGTPDRESHAPAPTDRSIFTGKQALSGPVTHCIGISGATLPTLEWNHLYPVISSFYIHAIQYVVVMLGLTILNLLTNPGYLWVLWPALGWGVGLMAHGLSVFEVINIFGDD